MADFKYPVTDKELRELIDTVVKAQKPVNEYVLYGSPTTIANFMKEFDIALKEEVDKMSSDTYMFTNHGDRLVITPIKNEKID